MWLWIWLVVAVAAALGEALTYDLFLASVAGAALLAAVSSVFLPSPVQIGVFSVAALLGIFVLRPAAKAALGIKGASESHAGLPHRTVVGRQAVVTQTVTGDAGQIRLGQGEFWSARAYDPTRAIEPGAAVRVMVIDGITALVEPAVNGSGSDSDARMLSEKGL